MKINAIEIRVGNVLEYEGKLWTVLKTMHTQPGKGGAYMQVEMKETKVGTKTNVRFRSSESVERAHLDVKDYQFLYLNDDMCELMDTKTYEQIAISKDLLGDQLPYLQDGMIVALQFYGEAPVSISLPESAVLKVEECEPVVKGQTAASSYKPAILENGVRISVPQFVNQGDKVVVKIATSEYVERAK